MELYSFLLMAKINGFTDGELENVSVSLWSYIHSYMMRMCAGHMVNQYVSVSLWSYIHSYKGKRF